MSLNEIVKTLILVRADTSDAKAQLKSLRGVEAQAARERLLEAEQNNRNIDKSIAAWTKAGVAVGGLVVAFKAAQAAAKNYLEDVRLESAAAGANIGRLNDATLGLIENDKLLAFAGKAQAGVWKLNQKEMESVLKGATALRKTMGVDLTETVDKLTESLAKGSTRGLKEFGIEAKDKQDAIRQLDQLFASLGGNVAMAGDEFKKSETDFTNAVDALSGSMGQLVVALGPVIASMSKVVDLITASIEGWKMLFGGESPWAKKFRQEVLQINADSDAAVAQMMGDALRQKAGMRTELWARDNPGQAQFVKSIFDALAKGPAKAKAPGRGGASAPDGVPIDALPNYDDITAFASRLGGAFANVGRTGYGVFKQSAADAKQRAFLNEVASIQGAQIQASAQAAQGKSYLETVFGTPAEIDAMTESLKLASDVFGGLTEAVTAGFDAWITGQKSIAAAFNEAIAEMLRGLAKQMLAESIKHAAFGFGSLAFGPIGGVSAAAHFKAAAMFGAGAVAAGGLAKGLGQSTGQWSQGASAGGGRASSPSRTIGNGPSSSDGNAPVIVYVGAEWAAMSKIEQANGIRNAIRIGKRGSRHVRRN